MIEKFTPEELAIIIQEINALPKNAQKGTICPEAYSKINELSKRREAYEGISFYRMTEQIFTLVDNTLCNYETGNRKGYRSDKTVMKRSGVVKPEMQAEYKEMVDELLDIIEKHFKEHM